MHFTELLRHRRMTRRYADEPVPSETVTRMLQAAQHSPSAGFSQGWDFVVLLEAADRERFWAATTDADSPADTWLSGLRTAPLLVLCLSDPQRYLDRYAEADKGWTDRSLERWPVPFWDTDTAMAALLMHLSAIDDGWGSCFFGVPAERTDAVLRAFEIPTDRRIVGVVSVGRAAPGPRSRSLKRGRRGLSEVAHLGRFGVPWPVGRHH